MSSTVSQHETRAECRRCPHGESRRRFRPRFISRRDALRIFVLGILLGAPIHAIRAQSCSVSTLPTPYIDITLCTGKGDTLENQSGNVGTNIMGMPIVTLNMTTGLAAFVSGDAQKAISISNAGLGQSGVPTVTTPCATGGTIPNGGPYSVRLAFFSETGGLVTSEGLPSTSVSGLMISGCTGNTGTIKIVPPTPLTGAAGYVVYVGTTVGTEVYQVPTMTSGNAACSGSLTTSMYGCNILSGSVTINAVTVDGQPPLTSSQLPAASVPSAVAVSGGGSLSTGTYFLQVAYIDQSGAILLDVGAASNEVTTPVTTAGSGIQLTVNNPGGLATGFVVYAAKGVGSATESGVETLQTANTASLACVTTGSSGSGCNFSGSSGQANLKALTTGGLGPRAQFGAFQTTIAMSGVTPPNIAILSAAPINFGLGINGVVVWGTDNVVPLGLALGLCPSTTFVPQGTRGCTVLFPGATDSTSTSSPTGRYYMSQGITIGQQNIVLQGTGSGGGSAIGGTSQAGGPRPSSEIVCAGRQNYCISVVLPGTPAPNSAGFEMNHVGIEDMSGQNGINSGGTVPGALKLNNVVNFRLDRVFLTNLSVGACIFAEGGTQVGTILDIGGAGCLHGIWFPQGVTAINITNGNLAGSGLGGLIMDPFSVGLYAASGPGVGGTRASGNIRVAGMQFRDFSTHVSYFGCGGCTAWDTKNEKHRLPLGARDDRIFVRRPNGSVNTCNLDAVGYAVINWSNTPITSPAGTGIDITANCSNSAVLDPLIGATVLMPVANADPTAVVVPAYLGTTAVTGGAVLLANDVVCFFTASTVQVRDCPVISTPIIAGVALVANATSSAGAVPLVVDGVATVNFDSSTNVTFGDVICLSTVAGMVGRVHDGGTSCPTGRQVGIAVQSLTSVTTVQIQIQIK